MVSNLTKKTFFYKFFKLNLLPHNLSLKQLIQQEILNAIALYQEQYLKVNNGQQIALSLPQKTILVPSQKASYSLVYRCAIAFPLANLTKLPPLSIAHHIVSLLPSKSEKTTFEEGLEVVVMVTELALIDFYIWNNKILANNQDCNLVIWLERLIASISMENQQQIPSSSPNERRILDKLFSLQYIYGRCNSLLALGERENLISLETKKLGALKWQIKQPSPFNWLDSQGNFCLSSPQELGLLWQICLIMDYLSDRKQYSLKHWLEFNRGMSKAWLNFVANCNFCGAIQTSNPSLATARLGLIALTQWCLAAIMISQFEIVPLQEI